MSAGGQQKVPEGSCVLVGGLGGGDTHARIYGREGGG